ncbi:hypothetical protein Pmar_PMAR009981 [Perkinsus marinus ATCC 50983]|uniref:Structure-specific endonuclease subunit SLX4 n=1 Tax=Perkinsus marinus (strain ATCC 50983 / TXsc) TaxID=423536 RepID=C5L2S4_PERM5|nr:hypothetical protein Pmar_PMAR009981 [Perkinsus marinus ATCC 50983]EER08989.1 hypothetical protein Pmar_PMAR009981 [Perkinsus marinus ATCC 50983]|eukprot:XP_002777173.1 hypothetical protein Pmar_PMAR009981 [Perkinsus marinus ATCC 50983]
MPPRKKPAPTTTRRKARGLPRCLDELDMDQDDITKYFKLKAGAPWTSAEVELLRRRIVTADRKIATLQLEKERLLNILHEVPEELLDPDGGKRASPSRPESDGVIDLSQDMPSSGVVKSEGQWPEKCPWEDREAATVRMMGRISMFCIDDLLEPSERVHIDEVAGGGSEPSGQGGPNIEIPPRPDGLPSPFPRVLDKHGPFLGKYPSVPGFFDDFDGLFVLSPTELVATIDELENLLATYLNPLVYTRKDLSRWTDYSVEFLIRLHEGVRRNKARGVSIEAVQRYLNELFSNYPRPKPDQSEEERSSSRRPLLETSGPPLARNMAETMDFAEQVEPLAPEGQFDEVQDIDQTEVMHEDDVPPSTAIVEAIPLTPNEMVTDDEGPVHLRYSEATTATLAQESCSQDDLMQFYPIIEVSGDDMSERGDGWSGPLPSLPSDDDDIQCLSGGSPPTSTPEKEVDQSGPDAANRHEWLSSLPLVERVKALGAMRRGSDVSRWANGTWKVPRVSLASLGVPESSADQTTLPYEDDVPVVEAVNDDDLLLEDSMADAVLVGGASQGALGETAASESPTVSPDQIATGGKADTQAGRSVLGLMDWEKLGDDELKRWMSFFGLKVVSGTSSRGNMVRTLTDIARYVEKGAAMRVDEEQTSIEAPRRKRQRRSPAKKSKEEKKREAEEKRRANKLALVHAIRKDTEMWQRMLLFETIDLTDLSTRLKNQDDSIVCDTVLLREMLEEQGVQFCNTLQSMTQRATRKPRKATASVRRQARS